MNGGGGSGSGGREGDWECSGCRNRNYAFRCFCNRCKQPRLLVDIKNPADSKWLPRIGDWICTGCTNNNYASREKCKKCGQPKEVAAMPALAVAGASVPTYPNYFARVQMGLEQKVNSGLFGNGDIQQLLPLSSSWSGGADIFLPPPSAWPVGGTNTSGIINANIANQFISSPKGWRNGDWICNCGLHNYSSLAQCKKCNASMPAAGSPSLVSPTATALGTKRLASEEPIHGLNNKRQNAGQTLGLPQTVLGQESVVYSSFQSGSSSLAPNLQFNMQMSPLLLHFLAMGQNNGVMEIGCAITETTTIMHLDLSVTGARHTERRLFSPSV